MIDFTFCKVAYDFEESKSRKLIIIPNSRLLRAIRFREHVSNRLFTFSYSLEPTLSCVAHELLQLCIEEHLVLRERAYHFRSLGLLALLFQRNGRM